MRNELTDYARSAIAAIHKQEWEYAVQVLDVIMRRTKGLAHTLASSARRRVKWGARRRPDVAIAYLQQITAGQLATDEPIHVELAQGIGVIMSRIGRDVGTDVVSRQRFFKGGK